MRFFHFGFQNIFFAGRFQKNQKRVFLSDKEFRKIKPLIQETNSQKGEKNNSNSPPLPSPVVYQSLLPLLHLRCYASGWPELCMSGQLFDW
jgi:hypothetical protein